MHPTFDAAFHKILTAIGDTPDRTCCHLVFFYVANKFLRFDLGQFLFSRHHDI